MTIPPSRRLFAELLGSISLTEIVIGAGVLAQQPSGRCDAVAPIGNRAATDATLLGLKKRTGPYVRRAFTPEGAD